MNPNWTYHERQITTCDKLKVNDIFYLTNSIWTRLKLKAKVIKVFKDRGIVVYDIYKYSSDSDYWDPSHKHTRYLYSKDDQIIIDNEPINYPKETT